MREASVSLSVGFRTLNSFYIAVKRILPDMLQYNRVAKRGLVLLKEKHTAFLKDMGDIGKN